MNAYKLLRNEMKACRRCIEAGYAVAPGAIFSGPPSAKAIIIGQAPGITENEAGRPFNAGSGSRLFEWLGWAGWGETEFRQNQYMTAVTKCYPGKDPSGKGDRVPSKKEQFLCRSFLEREINLIQPCLIMPVGRLAISQFVQGFKRLDDIIGKIAALSLEGPLLALPQSIAFSDFTDKPVAARSKAITWIVPLPHPSGASLWPNKAANKQLIQQAVKHIQEIRDLCRI